MDSLLTLVIPVMIALSRYGFVLNVVLDEKNSRIIYMMGYVYAPDGKKRNMLRQVESIVNSMKIDFPEEEKK